MDESLLQRCRALVEVALSRTGDPAASLDELALEVEAVAYVARLRVPLPAAALRDAQRHLLDRGIDGDAACRQRVMVLAMQLESVLGFCPDCGQHDHRGQVQ